MKLTTIQFVTLVDAALGEHLANCGFEPVPVVRSGQPWLRLYRAGDRYVLVSVSDSWRDERAHCQALLGEGPDSWPEVDWDSVGLKRLAGREADWYVLSTQTQSGIAEALSAIRGDLERYAADFLSGDTARFRTVRTALNESRQPYLITRPDATGNGKTTADSQSASLKERYGRRSE